MSKIYVHYGCGLSAPKEWMNFDASPTLRLQKNWLIGKIIRSKLNVIFPDNVKYGNIVKGLPIADESAEGVFCSHTLEHLSLNDCKVAIGNSYKMLKPGGRFRLIVPDLQTSATNYLESLKSKDIDASINFMKNVLLGYEEKPKGLKGLLSNYWGNSKHLWMWDEYSLTAELLNAGFVSVRKCGYADSEDKMFVLVENEYRFIDAVGLEAVK